MSGRSKNFLVGFRLPMPEGKILNYALAYKLGAGHSCCAHESDLQLDNSQILLVTSSSFVLPVFKESPLGLDF
jgi:hypothetical protein